MPNTSKTTLQNNLDDVVKRHQEWKRQWVGIGAGAGLGLMLLALFPEFAAQFGGNKIVLWLAAIGGIYMSLNAFERAGAALTRSTNRVLNLAVSLGFVAIVFILIVLIFA